MEQPRVGSLEALRERNRHRVIEALRHLGVASRADIARSTGLSRSTVSSLVADLQGDGFIVERQNGHDERERDRGTGRPGVLLALDRAAGAALAVDFGHRHVRVAVADLSSTILAERHRQLDVDASAPAALDAAAALATQVLEDAGVRSEQLLAVGMGVPGPIDRMTGEVGSSAILPGWSGTKPAEELERRLGVPIEVDNDANLGALAEVVAGAARGTSDLIYVKVSSGIGAGLVLGGRLHRGARGIAGEIGHVQVEPGGAVCRCGNRGCLETVAAAPAVLGLLRPSHGEDLDVATLLQLARDGDRGARLVLGDAGRAIGRALALLCNSLNPAAIVVGGELGGSAAPLLDGVREAVNAHALPAASEAVEVRAASLGERAELVGALALVIGGAQRTT